MRKPGITSATVIDVDVGVGAGTAGLMRAFPDAYHVLIEPQHEFEASLRQHLHQREGEVHLTTAVGAHDGETVLYVNPRRPMMTSLLKAERLAPAQRLERRVPLAKLDTLAARHAWQPPFGLKIDAEGTDHLVIEGATEVLRQCQFVIAEVLVSVASEFGLYPGSITFAEFIALMDRCGFELRDLLSAPRSSATGDVHYLDVFFRPIR